MERHPLNPGARRGTNGIWDEDSLTVMDWEIPKKRIVLPESLEHALDPPESPVLRWDAVKYRVVVAKHAHDLPIIDDLTIHLDQRAYVGTETVIGNVPVLFLVDGRAGMWSVSVNVREGTQSFQFLGDLTSGSWGTACEV